MDALLFVDTNILLDFYRVRGHGSSLALLDHLVEHGDKVITGNQVEMEYTKNRQRVILQSLEHLSAFEVDEFWASAFVAELRSLQVMKKRWTALKNQHRKVQQSIERLLQQPARHDAIYQKVQTLFTHGVRSQTSKEAKVLRRIRRLSMAEIHDGLSATQSG